MRTITMRTRHGETNIKVRYAIFCAEYVVDPLYLCRENTLFESFETEVPSEKNGCGEFVFNIPQDTFILTVYLFSAVDGAAAVPAPRRPNVQMPDEYLPPNKILFLQNLPESVTKDQLMSLFSQYVLFTSLSTHLIRKSTNLPLVQISQSLRSPSHPYEAGYCVRGIHGRRKCRSRQRRIAQL